MDELTKKDWNKPLKIHRVKRQLHTGVPGRKRQQGADEDDPAKTKKAKERQKT